MSLQEKILRLRMDALVAAKHAAFWQRTIDTYGEPKALAFYEHLGLNHLEKKSYEWEGLKLSREPKEHEKIAVKGIHQAQESSKETVSNLLLSLRVDLIKSGVKAIKKIDPASYHELVLATPIEYRNSLRAVLKRVHEQGRLLVSTELGPKGKANPNTPTKADETDLDEFDDLDLLTDLTNGRVVNDVQARIIAAAQRFSLLGQTGNTLLTSITSEITSGSVGYIDRAATGVANTVISIGRSDEAQNRQDDWGSVEYSALLDNNVCGPCSSADGETATNESDLTPTPNPECEGGDWCRCFHVFLTV